MNYYATLGESCKDAAVIAALLRAGISCFRLNLSHGSLREKADWIDALHRAERETGLSADCSSTCAVRRCGRGGPPLTPCCLCTRR